jgi:hypothetical protein
MYEGLKFIARLFGRNGDSQNGHQVQRAENGPGSRTGSLPGLGVGHEVVAQHKDGDEGQDRGGPRGLADGQLDGERKEEHHLDRVAVAPSLVQLEMSGVSAEAPAYKAVDEIFR